MSSNFCLTALCCLVFGTAPAAPVAAATAWRLTDVVMVPGGEISPFDGLAIDRLALLACTAAECHPIPFQVDERDAAGHWVLDHGPLPTADDPPEILDANDLLLFMATDAGERAAFGALPIPPRAQGSVDPSSAGPSRRPRKDGAVSGRAGKFENDRPSVRPEEPPSSGAVSKGAVSSQATVGGSEGFIGTEITLHDPLDGTTRWVYLVADAAAAPRAAAKYVAYDPVTDRVRGQRVSLGFADGVPGFFAVGDGTNLLDRLKVRATATFLFGLIHFSRSEADLRTQFMGWHDGPIRVVRGQRQWVRLGWGIHSPTFGSFTYFYRDFAALPVGLYLNFKPTHFFRDIVVQVILDFLDLRGWSLLAPSVAEPLPIDGRMSTPKTALASLPDTWFAVRGPQITLVQSMGVSPSLATVRHRLLYRETAQPEPPEAVPGEAPGIGYQFDQWESVGAGAHQIDSVSYALPPDIDVRAFMRVRSVPLEVSVRPLTRD